jgi:hypothetical protein
MFSLPLVLFHINRLSARNKAFFASQPHQALLCSPVFLAVGLRTGIKKNKEKTI